ncbi:MAG: Ldh family oxidoreductase, partial [bacterium]
TGHVFIAIDVEKFQSPNYFMARIDLLLSWIKGAGTDEHAVRFPGEIRGELALRYEQEGIPLPFESTVKPLSDLAQELNLETPW